MSKHISARTSDVANLITPELLLLRIFRGRALSGAPQPVHRLNFRGIKGSLALFAGRPGTSAICVRREKAALSSGCKSHPANAPAGSNRSSHGGDEMAEAFGVARHI
jgi:hypothetical protein